VAVRHLMAAGAMPAAIWRPRGERGHGGRHLRMGPPTRAAPIDAKALLVFFTQNPKAMVAPKILAEHCLR
jgi:hypothetical protein